ncbi:helix-turn-helix domain-containing protein [Streptomyces platensis]|uniref:helix-turn-helix domain-containing protein n=1 Tax=Streptomyces platensis TaxID=58346 RepID=UPI003689ECFC
MSSAGQNVKTVRKRRGLTQRELADASGVSLSTIRKLEQGDREGARLETLRKLAIALQVPTMRLVGAPREDGTSPQTSDRWAAVKSALERPPWASGVEDELPTVTGVHSALQEALPLFTGDRLTQLSVLLPSLLRDADALGPQGRTVRMRLLQLSGWLMVQTRQFPAAETALERALDHAADGLDKAATISVICWLRLRQGRLDEAFALAVGWADEIEPRMSRATPAELSTWGWLLVRASAAAIRNGQSTEADDALKLAMAAAVAMGREHAPENDFLRMFGPTTVKLKAAENASVTDRPDMVLRMAQRIPMAGLRPTSNNRNRHFLDVADAHAKMGQHADAFEKLEQIKADSPEWLPNQRYARDILSKLIKSRRTLTTDMRAMADAVGLPL